jgi:hypothetical protein
MFPLSDDNPTLCIPVMTYLTLLKRRALRLPNQKCL